MWWIPENDVYCSNIFLENFLNIIVLENVNTMQQYPTSFWDIKVLRFALVLSTYCLWQRKMYGISRESTKTLVSTKHVDDFPTLSVSDPEHSLKLKRGSPEQITFQTDRTEFNWKLFLHCRLRQKVSLGTRYGRKYASEFLCKFKCTY